MNNFIRDIKYILNIGVRKVIYLRFGYSKHEKITVMSFISMESAMIEFVYRTKIKHKTLLKCGLNKQNNREKYDFVFNGSNNLQLMMSNLEEKDFNRLIQDPLINEFSNEYHFPLTLNRYICNHIELL